jgi:hypothetical protein
MPNGPVKILTVEDCELRIKNSLDLLENPDSLDEDRMEAESIIAIWERVKINILNGATMTLDASETFGYWPKQ